MGDYPGLYLLIFGPAVIGVGALIVGIFMLRKPEDAPSNPTWRTVVAVLSLLFALGVGTCYGLVFLNPL